MAVGVCALLALAAGVAGARPAPIAESSVVGGARALQQLTPEKRAQLEGVAMQMVVNFVDSGARGVPREFDTDLFKVEAVKMLSADLVSGGAALGRYAIPPGVSFATAPEEVILYHIEYHLTDADTGAYYNPYEGTAADTTTGMVAGLKMYDGYLGDGVVELAATLAEGTSARVTLPLNANSDSMCKLFDAATSSWSDAATLRSDVTGTEIECLMTALGSDIAPFEAPLDANEGVPVATPPPAGGIGPIITPITTTASPPPPAGTVPSPPPSDGSAAPSGSDDSSGSSEEGGGGSDNTGMIVGVVVAVIVVAGLAAAAVVVMKKRKEGAYSDMYDQAERSEILEPQMLEGDGASVVAPTAGAMRTGGQAAVLEKDDD